jgi:hypothetical protein
MNSVMPIHMDHIQMIELTKERTHVKLWCIEHSNFRGIRSC